MSVSSVNQATVDPNLWVIHGESYDLNSFAKSHPGGEYILQLGKGRDCTELFESVHALSDMGKVKKMMVKYKINDSKQENTDVFVWDENGFYSVLSQKVSERFKNRNYKATYGVWFKLLIMFSLYIFCWYNAIRTGNLLWAAFSGVFTEMVGFCLMHGSSHNAFSKKPILNYLGLLWAPWMLWNHWTWLQHHVYGHHSYTGVYKMDPDLHSLDIIIRKHFNQKGNISHKFQHIYTWPLLFIIPGQHMAQILLYFFFPLITGKIFITKVIPSQVKILLHSYIIMFVSIIVHIILPIYFQSLTTGLLLFFTNFTLMGISYYFNVLPNHDTEETLRNHPCDKKLDWGEQQVRCTGNHSVSASWFDYIITQLWGGMNYQIEHHLFPTLNHTHYHEVSLIVQETCEEFDIPYVAHSSWLKSALSYSKFLHVMAKIPCFEEYASTLQK